jgi:hypothetical protein
VGHKKMRVVHKVFEHYGSQTGKYADDETEKYYQLSVLNVANSPSPHFSYDYLNVHFMAAKVLFHLGGFFFFFVHQLSFKNLNMQLF